MAGAVRRNAPRLVEPRDTVRAVTRRQDGTPSQQQVHRRIEALERETAAPVAPLVITGSWSDGTAGRSLVRALAQLGLVVDQTTR